MQFTVLVLILYVCFVHANFRVEELGATLLSWKNAGNSQSNKDTGASMISEVSNAEVMTGKRYVLLYFSASWCGPCKQFTPQLAKFYNQVVKQRKDTEIVWISLDRTESDFNKYYAHMPWLAVPFEKANAVAEALAPRYKMLGIPHLVVVDTLDGSVCTLDGRTKVSMDPYGLQFPWKAFSPMDAVKKVVRLSKGLASAKNILKGMLAELNIKKTIKSAVMGLLRINNVFRDLLQYMLKHFE